MTDEIKGLIAALRAPSFEQDSRWHGPKAVYATKPRALLEEAASLLTLSDEARVRAEAERDEALIDVQHYQQDTGLISQWRADAILARAQASEALVRELVGGLRPFGMLAEKWGIDDPNWDDDDIMLFANREGRLSEPPLLLVVGDFRKAHALILRAEGEGSSVAMSAAPVASQPGCSAAQSLDGGEG